VNSDDSRHEELPAELIAALRSLGGERAPAELAARVELVRSERLTAPPELWQRVSAELASLELDRAPDLDQTARPTRVLRWPRRLTVAAGIFMLGGIAWLAWPEASNVPAVAGGELVLASPVSPERQRALRARLVVIEVPPERLSPGARAFSEYYAAPAQGEG